MKLNEMDVREFRFDWWLLMLAIVPTLISFLISCQTGNGHWFARSGAIMVLSSAALEFRQAYFSQWILIGSIIHAARMHPTGEEGAKVIQGRERLQWAALSLLLLGTIIWAYGDLIFQLLFVFL